MKALHQTGSIEETKDSIDIALCIIESGSGNLQYSGANRPLIRIRNGELSEFKPDKMTIASLRRLKNHFQIKSLIQGWPLVWAWPKRCGECCAARGLTRRKSEFCGRTSRVQPSRCAPSSGRDSDGLKAEVASCATIILHRTTLGGSGTRA